MSNAGAGLVIAPGKNCVKCVTSFFSEEFTMSNKKKIKQLAKAKTESRNFMVVQQLAHLPFDVATIPTLMARLNAKNFAFIIHDQDINEDGSPVEPHVHIAIQFSNARHVSAVAKDLGIQPQYVQIWDSRINNAWSYLVHETAYATEKKLYSPSDVVASFDYVTKLNGIRNGSNGNEFQEALRDFADGAITKSELQKRVDVITYAKNKKLIEDVHHTLMERKHIEWLENHDPSQPIKFYWLYGKAGAGKSLMADALTNGLDVAKLGASNDYFQDYLGETIIVLNELRPNDIPWPDLLRLTDPWQFEKSASRRYRNVPVNMEMLIITTPYNPYDFYNRTKIADRGVDTVQQLLRRIDKLVYFDGVNPPQVFDPKQNGKSHPVEKDDLPF
ncbi:replication initiation protein [Weissella confusa]|nr:replication initiation protein [Weissella confusa]